MLEAMKVLEQDGGHDGPGLVEVATIQGDGRRGVEHHEGLVHIAPRYAAQIRLWQSGLKDDESFFMLVNPSEVDAYLKSGGWTLTPPAAYERDSRENWRVVYNAALGRYDVTRPTLFDATNLVPELGDEPGVSDDGKPWQEVAGAGSFNKRATHIINVFKTRRHNLLKLKGEIEALESVESEWNEHEKLVRVAKIDGTTPPKPSSELVKRREQLIAKRSDFQLSASAIKEAAALDVAKLRADLVNTLARERSRIDQLIASQVAAIKQAFAEILRLGGTNTARNSARQIAEAFPVVAGELAAVEAVVGAAEEYQDAPMTWVTLVAQLPIEIEEKK